MEDYKQKADAIAAKLTKKIETIPINQHRIFVPSPVPKDRSSNRQTGK